MTTVTSAFQDWADEGVMPSSGQVVFSLYGPILDSDTGVATTTAPVSIVLVDGAGSRNFDPTPVGNAVYVRVHINGFTDAPFLVAIPNVESISIVELLRDHQVAPGTLAPLPTAPTIAAAVAEAQASAQTALDTANAAKATAEAALPATGLDVATKSLISDDASATKTALNATIAAATANLVSKPQRATMTLTEVPKLLNSQRRYQQSAYSQDNVVTTPGGIQYCVIVGSDLHAWVCKRPVDSKTWTSMFDLTTIAGNPFGVQVDDSHCTWALAVDVNGRVIVTGNAHTAPSVAAYTTTPGDITAWTMLPASANQQLTTYDQFATLDDGTVLRFWREGFATGGVEWVSRWNPATLAFEGEMAILDGLTDEGPYIWHVAVRGQHIGLAFCWRGSGDASTNSDLGYMESLDGGLTWQKVTGVPYTLPVTHATADTIRATPQGSGLINQGGADIGPDGRPHVAYLMQDSVPYTQVWHTYWDGTAWVHEQVTTWSTLITTVGQTTLDLRIARPQLICTDEGRTYVITRTWAEGLDGAPVMIDVTPGAHREPFKIAAMNLYGWEPAIDSRALRERGELTMLLASTDYVKDSKPGWTAQWGGILTIRVDQLAQVQAGQVKIPGIRIVSDYTIGADLTGVGGTTENSYVGAGVPVIAAETQYVGPGARFFARISGRFTFGTSVTSGKFFLRETSDVNATPTGTLPTSDVAVVNLPTSAYAGVQSTPWWPLPGTPFVEADGTRRDTRLIPRAQASASAGLTVGGLSMQVGILDWV